MLGRANKHRSDPSHLSRSTCLRAVRSRWPRCSARLKNRLRVPEARQHFVVFCSFNMLHRHLCQRGVACRGPGCPRASFVGWRRTCAILVPRKIRCCCVSCHEDQLGRVSIHEEKCMWVVTTHRADHTQHAVAGCVKIVSKDPEVRSHSRRIRSIAPPCDHA